MYTKPEFAPLSENEVLDLIKATVFATVVTQGDTGLVVSHLPFVLKKSDAGVIKLESHLARANPHSQLIAEGRETVVIFNGPHGYISSSWYPAEPVRDSAPTWNFAVVHCHGRPVQIDDHATARHLLELVDVLEDGRENRWHMRELGFGGMQRRLPNIVGFALPITRIEAKFKMGQDERLYDTRGAIDVLSITDSALAETMKRHNADRKDG
ncbi:FMN-binding negative transcriptional regulator [Ochrobactrum pecoris]|uniref:Transcriptional regulator n=1 Tax=Brucella pecoris TaxID=867683 RepID=A0A5C5CF06_9HYPH|nr:FMN-binding negative transcriptional regulator [Brucella pecoris]MBB4095650.1 transcriptional regulator [Brucella pecoris]NKW81832.1 FMN-binding negative transcriptional regulator [Brucella pecoris]TNV09644.1 FMN-binding negative transcriptional regulator [Brucella pecoris]